MYQIFWKFEDTDYMYPLKITFEMTWKQAYLLAKSYAAIFPEKRFIVVKNARLVFADGSVELI